MLRLNGDSVMTKVSEKGIMVNNATVIAADIIACNGVIHVINQVLLPLSWKAATKWPAPKLSGFRSKCCSSFYAKHNYVDELPIHGVVLFCILPWSEVIVRFKDFHLVFFLIEMHIFYIRQADRAYGTEISPRSFVISFVILLYAISYNIWI